MLPQGPGIHIHAPQQVPGSLGQAIVPVRLQGNAVLRRDVAGDEFAHRHGLQHPAQPADVVPVEMGQQQNVQMGHALLFQEITGVDPAGTLVIQQRMVIPHQTVVAAVHQHGKHLPPFLHLPDQRGVAIAHVDEIQYQHTKSPCYFVVIPYHNFVAPGN